MFHYEASAYWIAPLRFSAPRVRLVNTTCDTVKNSQPAMLLQRTGSDVFYTDVAS